MITRIHRISPQLAVLLKQAAVCVLAGFVGLGLALVEAGACGFDNSLPSHEGGFLDRGDDYRMMHWERLGGTKWDETQKTEIPIHLSFTPILGYQTSSILGQGFLLMPFDAIFVQKDSDTFTMFQPSGRVERLTKTRDPHVLTGGGWIAKVSGSGTGQVVTAKASCGWTLVYNAGRLARMISPDNEVFDFLTDSKGSRQINRNGRKLMTLRRDFDPKTTLPLWHLDFRSEDGPKHAIFKMGYRQIFVTLPNKTTRHEGRRSLASIQFDNEPERRYDFKVDELKITNVPVFAEMRETKTYMWDAATGKLKRYNDREYSYPTIQGIECLKRTWDDGSFSISGHVWKTSVGILKERFSKDLYRIESFQPGSPYYGKMKARYILDENHRQTLVEKCEYNEHGHVIRHYVNGEIISYSPTLEVSKDAKTEKIRWLKKFDDKRQILEFQTEENSYVFVRKGTMTEVTVTDKEADKIIAKVTIPTDEIQKTFCPD